MENFQADYDYEAERRKLKLSPAATCVLLFKSTVGVGIFTYQYAYSICGFLLGTLLSILVFYMVVYGMLRLVDLCDLVEQYEAEKRSALKTPPAEVQIQQACSEQGEGLEQRTEENSKTSAALSAKPEDLYEIGATSETYQVVTYHRRLV